MNKMKQWEDLGTYSKKNINQLLIYGDLTKIVNILIGKSFYSVSILADDEDNYIVSTYNKNMNEIEELRIKL